MVSQDGGKNVEGYQEKAEYVIGSGYRGRRYAVGCYRSWVIGEIWEDERVP
jgi:hypothetical protein